MSETRKFDDDVEMKKDRVSPAAAVDISRKPIVKKHQREELEQDEMPAKRVCNYQQFAQISGTPVEVFVYNELLSVVRAAERKGEEKVTEVPSQVVELCKECGTDFNRVLEFALLRCLFPEPNEPNEINTWLRIVDILERHGAKLTEKLNERIARFFEARFRSISKFEKVNESTTLSQFLAYYIANNLLKRSNEKLILDIINKYKFLTIDDLERLIPHLIDIFIREMVAKGKDDCLLESEIFTLLKKQCPGHLKNAILKHLEDVIRYCLQGVIAKDSISVKHSLNRLAGIIFKFELQEDIDLNLIYKYFKPSENLENPHEFFDKLLQLIKFFVATFPPKAVHDFMKQHFKEIAGYIFNRDFTRSCHNGEHIEIIQYLIQHFPDQFRHYIKKNIKHVIMNFRTQEELELLVTKLAVNFADYTVGMCLVPEGVKWDDDQNVISLKKSKAVNEFYYKEMKEIKAFLDEHFDMNYDSEPGIMDNVVLLTSRFMGGWGVFSENTKEAAAKKVAEEKSNIKRMPSSLYWKFYVWLERYLKDPQADAASHYNYDLVGVARTAIRDMKEMSHFERLFYGFFAFEKYFHYPFSEFRKIMERENKMMLLHGIKDSMSALRHFDLRQNPIAEPKLLGEIFRFLSPDEQKAAPKNVDGNPEMQLEAGRWEDIGLDLPEQKF